MRRLSLLLAASLPIASGCTSTVYGEEHVDKGEVELSSELRLMENHPNCEDVVVAPDRLTFLWRTDASGVDIDVGSVVVGEKGGGYVRRVSSIVKDGNTIDVTTEPASLSDAVLAGGLSMPLVQPDDWLQCPEGTACAATDLIDLANMVLFDGVVDGVELSVRVPRAEIDFSPAVNFDMSVAYPGDVERLSGTVSGAFSADLQVEAHASGPIEFAQEIDASGPTAPLYSYPFTFVAPTPLGPLPITGTADVDVFVGFRASVSEATALATGVNATADIEVGATYEYGEWSASAEPSFDAFFEPIQLAGDATTSIEVYARPQVSVTFYGVAGPRIGLEPLVRFTRDPVLSDQLHTQLDACMRGELGFSVQIFSFSIADFSTSIERCLNLFESVDVATE
jgi:hypothetical protein